MTGIFVGIHEGAYRCFTLPDGRTPRYFGPRFGGPTSAARYADLCAADTFRAPAGGSSAVGLPPVLDGSGMEPPAGSPKGGSRSADGAGRE